MPRSLTIAPNKPVTLALVNPEGQFDFEVGIGRYQTTTGELLTLPRAAVVILNALEPAPGEEIQITKHWSGKAGEQSEWTIALSPRSEKARAQAEKETQEPAEGPETVNPPTRPRKEITAPPTPIRRPAKRQPAPEIQPRLFDRGTGTHGPAPAILPALAPAARIRPGQIPANVATCEILEFVNADPGTQNWSADAKQDLCSTILIASFKAGYIGLWERRG
jgi:hypothetical protein